MRSAQWMSSTSSDQGTSLRRDLQRAPDRPERLLGRERLLDQPDRRPDALGHVLVAREHRGELDPGRFEAVVGPDTGRRTDDLADRPVRDALSVREAAALQRGGVGAHPFEELLEQTRLPHARRDRRPSRCGTGSARPTGGTRRAGSRARPRGRRSGRSRRREYPSSCPDTPISRYAGTSSALPFSGSGSTCSTITASRTSWIRRLADQDLHRRRVLLEPGGGVHGVAGHQALSAGHVAGDDLAGVHTGPVLQAHAEPLEEHLVHVDEALLHLERRADGPHRVVLVQTGESEHRHDRVADVLLDPAAVPLEHQPHLVEIEVQHLAEVLAVQAFAERGGALEVREHDGDGPADLFDGDVGSEARAAEATQAEPVRVLFAAIRADLHVRESTPGPRGPGVTPRSGGQTRPFGSPAGARNVRYTKLRPRCGCSTHGGTGGT